MYTSSVAIILMRKPANKIHRSRIAINDVGMTGNIFLIVSLILCSFDKHTSIYVFCQHFFMERKLLSFSLRFMQIWLTEDKV